METFTENQSHFVKNLTHLAAVVADKESEHQVQINAVRTDPVQEQIVETIGAGYQAKYHEQ